MSDPRYTAVIVERTAPLEQHDFPLLTAQQLEATFKAMVKKGCGPTLISAMGTAGEPLFAAEAIALAIGHRSRGEIVGLFETEGLTAAPVYDIVDIMEDQHFKARHTFIELPDPDLGTVTMNAPTPRLSETPGTVRAGPPLGAHNREVYADLLGLTDEEMATLKAGGII